MIADNYVRLSKQKSYNMRRPVFHLFGKRYIIGLIALLVPGLSSAQKDTTSFRGYFYYPNAPEEAGMTIEDFEMMLIDSITVAVNEYNTNSKIDRDWSINYIGPMLSFNPNHHADQMHALSITGQGGYEWVNQKRSEYHLAEIGFIVPPNHPMDAQGGKSLGRAFVVKDENRSPLKYIATYNIDVILNGYRSTINHETAHYCGVNHQLPDGDLGGDPNGYAGFIQGEYGTANMASLNGGAYTVNTACYPGFVWKGVLLGTTPQHNSRRVILDELPHIEEVYTETQILIHDTLVTKGDPFQLNTITNGDIIEYIIIEGDITSSGDDLIASSSGQVIVSARQSGTLYSVSDTVNITVNTVSTHNISNDDRINIYPNPTSDYIKIDIAHGLKVQEIIVYDQNGRKVIQSPATNQISLDGLPNGQYQVKVFASNEVFATSVIKGE